MPTTESKYSATVILSRPPPARECKEVLHFTSLEELRLWALRTGYVIGEPKLHSPFYHPLHSDGTELSTEEVLFLQAKGTTETYRDSLDLSLPKAWKGDQRILQSGPNDGQ